jgi:transposase
MIHDLWLSIQQANEQILGYDQALKQLAREDDIAKRLLTIPGVGEQIATGVVASMPDPQLFKNSRQSLPPGWVWCRDNTRRAVMCDWGDKYLRMCLVHRARAVIAKLGDKQDHVSCSIRGVIERRGYLRAVVALAARNAKLISKLQIRIVGDIIGANIPNLSNN